MINNKLLGIIIVYVLATVKKKFSLNEISNFYYVFWPAESKTEVHIVAF